MLKSSSKITGLILPALLLVIWQITASKVNDAVICPSPSAVFDVLIHPGEAILGTSSWAYHLSVSFIRVILGFSIAAIVAVPLGILIGKFKVIEDLGSAPLLFLQPLSPIMWIPFAMIFFKGLTIGEIVGLRRTASILNDLSIGMIFVIAYGAFFPIFVNTMNAVKGVPKRWIEAARLLGTSPFQQLYSTILPASLPGIFTGLQIGLARAWMVIAAAEMLPGSEAGLGYLVQHAFSLAEMHVIVAGMIIAGITGAILHFILKKIAEPFTFWQNRGHE